MAHSSINNGRLGLRCGRSAVSALAAGAFLCWSLSSCSESESDSFSHTGEIPDMSTFIQIGGCGLAGLNWQGDGMYFTSSMSGKSQVFRHMGKHQWPWQLTVFSDGIDGFTLSEDGKWGIVRASVGGSEQSQLYLMNMSNGAVDTLTDFEKTQTGSVIWAPDNESIFFRSNHETEGNFQVYRMDILAREITPVFDQPEYDIPAGITRDGAGLFVYSFRSNADNDLHLVDLQTGESTKLNEGDGEFNYFNPTLMPDGKTVFMLSNNNTDGITRIARMRLGNPSLEYVTDWIDPKWTIDDLGFSRDFKYMYAIVNEDGYARLRIREASSAKELPPPPVDGIVSSAEFDKNGNIYFGFSGATRAPDVWKYNLRSQELEQITQTMYAGIDRRLFSDPSLIKFTSFDGLEIPAFLYLPPDYTPGRRLPFYIYAHGGPESQFQPSFARNFQYFILNGYGVLAVNPRGSSGYTKAYMELDNYKNRKNSLKDYKAGIDWLIEKGYTEKGRIGIYGGSYGGYVVLGMITEYPELLDAAICNVGISNFVSFLERTAPYRRAVREAEYGPLSDPEFLESVSPLNKADQIRTPLFVIHGENDPRVPVYEARQILEAVAKNGTPVDSLIFPDEGHGAAKRVNQLTQYRRMVEFFDTHLKGAKIKGSEET